MATHHSISRLTTSAPIRSTLMRTRTCQTWLTASTTSRERILPRSWPSSLKNMASCHNPTKTISHILWSRIIQMLTLTLSQMNSGTSSASRLNMINSHNMSTISTVSRCRMTSTTTSEHLMELSHRWQTHSVQRTTATQETRPTTLCSPIRTTWTVPTSSRTITASEILMPEMNSPLQKRTHCPCRSRNLWLITELSPPVQWAAMIWKECFQKLKTRLLMRKTMDWSLTLSTANQHPTHHHRTRWRPTMIMRMNTWHTIISVQCQQLTITNSTRSRISTNKISWRTFINMWSHSRTMMLVDSYRTRMAQTSSLRSQASQATGHLITWRLATIQCFLRTSILWKQLSATKRMTRRPLVQSRNIRRFPTVETSTRTTLPSISKATKNSAADIS